MPVHTLCDITEGQFTGVLAPVLWQSKQSAILAYYYCLLQQCQTIVDKGHFHLHISNARLLRPCLSFFFFLTCVSGQAPLTHHCATPTRREQAAFWPQPVVCIPASLLSLACGVEVQAHCLTLMPPSPSSPPLPLPLQLLNSSSPLFTNRGTTMLWDKLCWLLALLALSSGGLPPLNDSLSTPRIFLSFKGKPHNGDVATH